VATDGTPGRLKRARQDKGFRSAAAFARTLGESPATYQYYESGRRPLSLRLAEKYAGPLGVDPRWLLFGESRRGPRHPAPALGPGAAAAGEPAPRAAAVRRTTRETAIELDLALDGSGSAEVATGLGFLDHMLATLARHAGFDLRLLCKGDLDVDDHHTAEDCAIALGQALDRALGERRGIARFAHAYAPLDEALARVVVDLSGRPSVHIDLGLRREAIGRIACENLAHVFASLGMAGRMALHVDVLRGDNDHHRVEAAFKALALALRRAVARTGPDEVPSTKGTLTA
jgi:imidazoleglycerol phosphate dehydratase HisB